MLQVVVPGMRLPVIAKFQWAPTLGGECYKKPCRSRRAGNIARFNGHPPLGVNATEKLAREIAQKQQVSMGTHPWG